MATRHSLRIDLVNLAAIAGLALAGCGDGATPGQQAVQLGPLAGNLADEIPMYFDLASDGATDLPVIVGEVDPSSHAERLAAAFAANAPIIVLRATEDRIRAVRGAVGLPEEYELTDEYVDAYGIEMEADGDYSEIVVLAPELGTVESLPVEIIAEDGSVTLEDPEPPAPRDDEDAQVARAAEVAAWCQESDVEPESDFDDAPPPGLEDVASSGLDDLTNVATSYQQRHVYTFRGNIHQIQTFVWSVYDQTRRENWFYVEVVGNFQAANAITVNRDLDRGYYTQFYRLETHPGGGMLGNLDEAFFHRSTSPPTTERSSTVTTSQSWSLTGSLSFSPKGPSVGLSGGVSVSRSRSETVPDVRTVNLSASQGNDARWEFNLSEPAVSRVAGCISVSLSNMSDVSRAGYQPAMFWTWRISDDVRNRQPSGFRIRQNFETRVNRKSIGGPFCPVRNRGEAFSRGVTFRAPWPPR